MVSLLADKRLVAPLLPVIPLVKQPIRYAMRLTTVIEARTIAVNSFLAELRRTSALEAHSARRLALAAAYRRMMVPQPR